MTPPIVRRLLAAAVTAAVIFGMGASTASASVTSVEGTPFSGVVTALGAQCPSGTITSATVTWGDGASSAATVVLSGNLYNVSGTHTYARYGTYAGAVSVGVNCNGATFTQQGQFFGTITDAPLKATGVAVSAVPGQAFTATVAHLTDGNPDGLASDDTASINWGDGTTSAATIVPAAGGGFDLTGTHTYATAGQDLISVDVTSSGGSHASANTTATVAIPPSPKSPSVHASFSVVGAPLPGRIVLNASASAPSGAVAAHYDWKVASAPGQDVVCPGDEPQLQLDVHAKTKTTVTLATVDAATGISTSTSQRVSVAAPYRRGARDAAAESHGTSVVGLCSGSATPRVPPLRSVNLPPSARPPVSVGGAPPAGCDQDLVFGAADVRGCLKQIPDPKQLPGGIGVILAKLLCGAQDTDFCLDTGTIAKAVGVAAASVTPQKLTVLDTTLRKLGFPSYYSYSAIRLDGVDIVPQNGSPILIIPAAKAIVATGVRVFLAGHPIEPATIPLALYVPATGGHLGTLTLPHALPLIGSLPFNGSIAIDLARAHTKLANGDTCQYACAALTVSAELPGVLSDDDGNGLSATGVVTADAVNGVQLDSLEVKVPSAQLAGIGVSDVDIRYSHATDSLHAQATVNLFDAAGNISGSIDFTHAAFHAASVSWDAGDGPGIDLGGPLNIYLTHLGGSIALNPTTISATGTITGGPQTLGCSLFGMTGTITMQFGPFSMDANATGQLLCQNVADEYFHLDQSGSILIGGDVDISLYFFEFKGGIAFAADTAGGHLQADANMSACINIYGTHCIGAEVVVSDRGAGLCADLGFTHAGGGIQWPNHELIFFDSCDIGKFRSLGFTTAMAHGDQSRTVTITRGQSVSVIGFKGSGAAPQVTLHGPHGQIIDTPATGYEKTAHRFVVVDNTNTQETYFVLDHMTPGRWTVTTNAGSAPVTAIQQAAGLPNPEVRAQVRRERSGRLVLSYRLHPLAGQRVTFVQRAGRGETQTIGAARGAHGQLSLAPSPTMALKRTIIAEVTQDGRPREDDIVSHYTAVRPKPLPGPRSLRATRSATKLAISWRKVASAGDYAVTVRLADGTRRYELTRRTTATLSPFPTGTGATVQVSALRVGRYGRIGKASSVRVPSAPRERLITVRPIG